MKKITAWLLHVLLLCTVIPGTVFSQKARVNISGYVLDSASFNPLFKATIELQKSHEKKTYYFSDSLGKFNINNIDSGLYNLSISSTGYKIFISKNIRLYSDTFLTTVRLVPDPAELTAVTITAKAPTIIQKFDKLIVGVANTSLTASGNIFDLLQKLPGVIVQQDGLILLKGKSVEVWIDNRPTNLYGIELKNFLNSLPANSVDKVELISNPSAKYDASASAIINIRTIKIRKTGFNGTATLAVAQGIYPRSYPALNLSYQKKNLTIYSSYSYIFEKEYIKYNSDRKTNFGSASGFINNTEYNIEKREDHQVKAGLDYAVNKRQSAGFLFSGGFNKTSDRLENFTYLFTSPSIPDSVIYLSSVPGKTFSNPSVNVYYTARLDSLGSTLKINLDYWNYHQSLHSNFDNYFYNQNNVQYREPGFLRNTLPGKNEIKSAKADLESHFKKGTLSAGVKITGSSRDNDLKWEFLTQGNTWLVDTGKTNHFLFKEEIFAGYIGYEQTIKKFGYQAVLRTEETRIKGRSVTTSNSFKQDYLKIFPSINLDYNLSAVHQFSISYRKSINRPTFDYLDPFLIFISQFNSFRGNPQLKPQIVNSIQLSHGYKQTLFTNFSYSSINNGFSRIFSKDPATNKITTTYDNLSNFKNYSLDFSASKSLNKHWFALINGVLSYSSVNTVFNNAPLVNRGLGANLSMFNIFSLPKSRSVDVFLIYAAPYAGTVFKYKSSALINAGFHMPVLKSKATLNFFAADIFRTARAAYSTRIPDINLNYYKINDDRYLQVSLNFKFGNSNNKPVNERKTGIETEKKRMKKGNE